MTAEIKKSPAMMAAERFSRLLQLEDKAQSKYLSYLEREERQFLRVNLAEYLTSMIKGEAAAEPTEQKVPA